MNLGMLWFDNDPKATLEIKIERAAAYYQHKYSHTPTLCFVHPTMISFPPPTDLDDTDRGQSPIIFCGIEVKKNRSVLPNHFWIGVQERTA